MMMIPVKYISNVKIRTIWKNQEKTQLIMKKKHEIDTRFSIAVNTGRSALETVNLMGEILPHLTRSTALSFLEDKNRLVLEKNFEHDNNKLYDEDGWMFYQYEISIFPITETDMEYQRNLSKRILDAFRNHGYLAEIICDSDFPL
ncbi:hypothetical protein [Pectobacterium sp. B1J-3]|uniref:hypothetical protein n=1 Tax=Pectobacterium sp. B1J-3 TaxID=3385371 RepID=UPI003906939B